MCRGSAISCSSTAPRPSWRPTSRSVPRCSCASTAIGRGLVRSGGRFDPSIVEWHRRGKADRPSGTARAIARRIVAADPRWVLPGPAAEPRPVIEMAGIRAGATPGSHLVTFDGAGESVELRITARDRSAYADGALAAARWLAACSRASPGVHPFDAVIDDLLSAQPHPRPSLTASDRKELPHDHDERHRPDERRAGPAPALRGAFTALVTPFTADGGVDEHAYRRLIAWQILAGIDGLVPVGHHRRGPDARGGERERLIEIAVATAAERAPGPPDPDVAGTGTNDTRASIEATRRAAALGADAALVVTPYYNRPDQRMLEAHFRAVADEGGLPIVVYNVPSRTGCQRRPPTRSCGLRSIPRVVAVKEASGNIEQIAVICRDRPRRVAVLAGDDVATLAVLAMGGDGVVSVASNEIPGELARMVRAARPATGRAARHAHDRWLPLFRANFRGAPNPVPAKAAMLAMGLLERDDLRPPLLPLADEPRERLGSLLRTLGLVDGGGRQPGGVRRRPRGRGGRLAMVDGAPVGGRGVTAPDPDVRHAGELASSTTWTPDAGGCVARSSGAGGWRVDRSTKAAILERFRGPVDAGLGPRRAAQFRDRTGLPLKRLLDGPARRARRGRRSARGGSCPGARQPAGGRPPRARRRRSCRPRTSTSGRGSAGTR